MNLAEKKRIEAEAPKGPKRRAVKSVKTDPWSRIYSSSTAATESFMKKENSDDYVYGSPSAKVPLQDPEVAETDMS
jgi:hypothetical protein